MVDKKKCRACGVDVPSNAPFGHCPQCLLQLGFGAVAGDAIEPSEDSALPIPQSTLGTVRYFGDYELLEEIGRGGMGIVYKARQQSLNRTVALKMISAGEFASPSAVQRFQIEAEAAAKLDHPNIVPIYEIGVHRGQHYFSMKFVEGRSLAEEIRTGKFRFSKGANPPSKASERERQSAVARLMTTVAHSVHYAHQHGVLHRDLKPGNILVDAEGQPHLTDFGLAKIIEQEVGVSGSTSVLGTPSYMSPEQANARPPTTATDVYSLGAILYELLTGRPPFCGATPMEIFQQLAQEEPAHPQTLNPALDRDLTIICLKCLEKDPAKRYPSAEALAEELTRFVANEPIMARSVSRREKVWRWCKRKPALSGALSGLLLVFVLGFVGVCWQWLQAKANEETALAAAKFLENIFTGVRPSVALGRDTTLLREILDKAAAKMARDLKTQPHAESNLRRTIGMSYAELGDHVKAEEMFCRCLALEEGIHGRNHLHVAAVLSLLGDTLRQQGRLFEAEPMHRRALAITADILGTKEHSEVAPLLGNLALVLQEQGKLQRAEAIQREVLAINTRLFGNQHPRVATALHNLGVILIRKENWVEAEAVTQQALRLRKQLLGDEHPDVLNSLNSIAGALQSQGKFAEAEKMHRELLRLRKKLLNAEHPEVARSQYNLALALQQLGKTGESETLFRETLSLQRKMFGDEHRDIAESLNGLAGTLIQQGKLAEAEGLLHQALVLQKKFQGNEHERIAAYLSNLAAVLQMQGRLAEAETLDREALAMYRKLLGNVNAGTLKCVEQLATVLDAEEKLDQAEEMYREAITLTKQLRGEEHINVAKAINQLGVVHHRQGKLADAEADHRAALDLRKKLADPAVADSWHNLGLALFYQRKLPQAESAYRAAVETGRTAWTNAPRSFRNALNNLASVLDEQGRHEEVEPLLIEANALAQNSDQVPDADKRHAMEALSTFYMRWAGAAPGTGKIQKSMEWGRKVAEFDKALKEKSSVGQMPQAQTLDPQQSESARVGQYFTETARRYLQVAEQGDADAQFNLGACYAQGLGVAQDFGEAAKWFGKAAEQNHGLAQKQLAFYYADGRGVKKDEVEAEKWFRRAAEQNDLEAQRVLGLRYAVGHGVPKNLAESVKWLHKAAEQNDAAAQLGLGLCYANGEGVVKNDVEAASWFLKAAKQNHPRAQYNLGFCYATGSGVAKDYAEAVNWYRKAADQNDAAAEVNLGNCYADGLGVAKDEVEALKWYRKAAEQNDAIAQVNLGRCYAKGLGAARDEVEALKWYRRAAEANDAGGQGALAWLLATSNDPAIRDGSKAVLFAEKSVAVTNRKSPANLGTLAAAYAEAGQFEKAVSIQREAIALLKTEEEKKDYTSRLKLYEAKVPYRTKD